MSNVTKNILDELEYFKKKSNWAEEIEEKRWENEKKNNDFLNFLIKYINENSSVMSDAFDYNEKECNPYSSNEFCSYLFSLYDFIDNYCIDNYIKDRFLTTEEDYFTEKSYCIRINNCFYKIELVSGQGSYILFGKVDNNENYPFAIYEYMLDNKECDNLEENVKDLIFNELNVITNQLEEKEKIKKILIKKYMKEFIENMED